MTREKARDAIILAITADIKLALIDKIYDDFESRVCENCKYFTYCDDGFHYCDNQLNVGFNGLITEDFGCNRFERRENV